jgi:GPI ethanolamine phosphate transferase 1
MTKIGSSGVSYSRVPTESRPGHVAIIAGFYEDISAVTRGWKENPIEFDSLFNRSTYCFAWGSPDILLLFTRHSHKINANYYSAYEENFASQNASLLDIWVLDKFNLFIEEAKQNKTLNDLLNKKGIVFFFHLLGIDTNGHSKKPHSKLG